MAEFGQPQGERTPVWAQFSPSFLLALAGILFAAAMTWGAFERDHVEQVAMRAEVNTILTSQALLEQKIGELDRRGSERTAARDRDIADLNAQVTALSGVINELRLAVDRAQAEVRAVREGLSIPQPTYPPAPTPRPDWRG